MHLLTQRFILNVISLIRTVLGVAASAFSESKSFVASEACTALNQVLVVCPVMCYLGLVRFCCIKLKQNDFHPCS